jgi:hypothetical protein
MVARSWFGDPNHGIVVGNVELQFAGVGESLGLLRMLQPNLERLHIAWVRF